MTMTRSGSVRRLLALLVASSSSWVSSAYPLIAEVPENDQKCFRFNIPKDDDAHMVFMALPSTLPDAVEEWYVDQVVALVKSRGENGGVLARKFNQQPDEAMLKTLDEFLNKHGRKTNLMLRIQKPRSPRPMRQQELTWFIPVVINHVDRYQRGNTKDWQANAELDGYSVCYENRSENQAMVIFDIVLVSEDLDEEEASITKKHLTPLEQELAASINAANSIVSEMRYMERREARMRVTTESINSRIRFFSYVSVGVLLTVTYLQVTYLKRYFKKKKLM